MIYMAAFSSNIDITSGGTYGMDVTNGESSLKVANDLNGKMANIQQYLQNGLPEVWTGDSLPDSLPYGKILFYNDNLYYYNNSILTVSTIVNFGTYTGTGRSTQQINLGFHPKGVIVIDSDSKSDTKQSLNFCGLGIQGNPINAWTYVYISETGFTAEAGLNLLNYRYGYAAFK